MSVKRLFLVVLFVFFGGVAFVSGGPTQQPIRIDGAITASAPSEVYGPVQNLVNGSGLVIETLQHDYSSTGIGMWVTGSGGLGSSANHPFGLDCSTWVRFDFDKSYSLGLMMLWNHNQWLEGNDMTDRGLRNVSIHYTNDGTTWTHQGDYEIAQCPALGPIDPTFELDFAGTDANSVVITAAATDGNWGSIYYGMSEVMFGIDGTTYQRTLTVEVIPSDIAGTVVLDPAGGVYDHGSTVTLTATAAVGYASFDHWDGDLTGSDNPVTITMDADKSITAHFTFTFNGDVVYVDANSVGANDGSSWADAFTDLQAGLVVATAGKDIWVAEGTYTPGTARVDSFALKNGVGVYGGFAGTETERDQRDFEAHPTILSGDIGVIDDMSDNCYQVFYHPAGTDLDATAILDGFTITAGNGGGTTYDGGGMCNDDNNSPTVSNCIFSGNSADDGGGMYNDDYSSPTVSNCTFSGNSAGDDGGGMYNDYDCIPAVSNCTFSGNSAGYDGGGMYNYGEGCNPTITNCTFSSNSASSDGGGMHNYDNSGPRVSNCTFSGNSAGSDGGGMMNEDYSWAMVSNCTFSGNSAGDEGGGMCNEDFCSPTVTHCTFNGNSAVYDGGGIYNYDVVNLLVSNCIFSGNSADDDGGGIYIDDYSGLTVTNCTFSGNSAVKDGGGIYNDSDRDPIVSNCIIRGNTAGVSGNEIYNEDSSDVLTIGNSNIAGSGSSGTGWDASLGTDEGGNIDADPLFVDPNGVDNIAGTDDDDLSLLDGSPCIDAGKELYVFHVFDIAGNSRYCDNPDVPDTGYSPVPSLPVVDMGAYEFPCEPLEGDINGDGVVDMIDLAILAANWLAGAGD